MKKLCKVIAISLWASPLTIVGLIYTSLLSMFGWYKFSCICENSIVFTHKKPPQRFLKVLKRKSKSHSIGQVMIMREQLNDNNTLLYKHQLQHVKQAMRFGIFYPICDVVFYLVLTLLPSTNSHYDNPFEIAARRSCNQYIDMAGLIFKINKG